MQESDQLYDSFPLHPEEKPPVPTEHEGGWAPIRSLCLGEEKAVLVPEGIKLWNIKPTA